MAFWSWDLTDYSILISLMYVIHWIRLTSYRASATDGNSSTAADLAEMHGHDDIANLIRSRF